MRTICVVITARPSYARVKTAIQAIEAHRDLELQLVVAASAVLDRYGNVEEVAKDDGFELAGRVHMVVEGENLLTSVKTTGLGMIELATVLDNLRPDAVVTIADRYETLATATTASYLHLPLVHLQGGEVTGSIDEKVRHAVTKLADLHLVCTERAKDYVVRMGEDPAKVVVTGCPSIDLARHTLHTMDEPFDPYAYGGVGPCPDLANGYVVVLQHPVTTEAAEAQAQMEATLQGVCDATTLPALVFWPNIDAGSDGTAKALRRFREQGLGSRMHWFRNMPPEAFLRLLAGSTVLVGNSSVGIREASYLAVPTVNIGRRQRGRERGDNVIEVREHEAEAIRTGIRDALTWMSPKPSKLYGDGRAGLLIAEALATMPLSTEKRLMYPC